MKKNIRYMHTMDSRPAYFDSEHKTIFFMGHQKGHGLFVMPVAETLTQIKNERAIVYEKFGDEPDCKYGWVKFSV